MSKHTPGPWCFGSVIQTQDHVGIAQIIDNEEWPNGQVEANARLIAAAPEMLAALKATDELLARLNYRERSPARKPILGAIAKAEGRYFEQCETCDLPFDECPAGGNQTWSHD